jgi:hypothetical protein
MGRILEINALQEVTKAVVEAARESLVIGETWSLSPRRADKGGAMPGKHRVGRQRSG